MDETISKPGTRTAKRSSDTAKRAGSAAKRPTEPTVRRAAKLASDLVILVCEATPRSADARDAIEVARIVEERPSGDLRLALASGQHLDVASTWWQEVCSELRDLVREELAPLDADERERVLE